LLNRLPGLSIGRLGKFPDDGLGGTEGVLDGEGPGGDLFFAVVLAGFAGGETGEGEGQGEEGEEFPLGLLGIVIRGHEISP